MAATSTPLSEPLPDVLADPLASARPSSLWRDTLRNILRQRSAIFGLTVLVFLILVAIFAPVIATHDPNQPLIGIEPGARPRLPPCIHLLGCPEDQQQYLMGLDGNARDVFSRVVYGAQVDLQVGFLTVGFAIILGTLIGAIAGYAGGSSDNLLMRVMDVVLAFPSLLLAIAIVTVLGAGLINAQLAIGIVAIPVYARIMRSSVLSIREQDYVTASRALGESGAGIVSRTQSELVREALRRYFSGFPVVAATPAELAAIARGRAEFERGEYVRLDGLLNDPGTRRHKVRAKRSPKTPAKRSRAR